MRQFGVGRVVNLVAALRESHWDDCGRGGRCRGIDRRPLLKVEVVVVGVLPIVSNRNNSSKTQEAHAVAEVEKTPAREGYAGWDGVHRPGAQRGQAALPRPRGHGVPQRHRRMEGDALNLELRPLSQKPESGVK